MWQQQKKHAASNNDMSINGQIADLVTDFS